jgi:hypothetical protein
MTDNIPLLTLSENEARAFASSPRFQAYTLRRLRRRALARRLPAVLLAREECLATCSPTGAVNVIGPLLVECEAHEITLYRVDGSTYLVHGEHLIQLERRGVVWLRFVSTIPRAVVELRDGELTPSLRALADAAETFLLGGWPAGYYRDRDQVLWSSGHGRIYLWTGTALIHVPRPSARARPMNAEQTLALDHELRDAVERLQSTLLQRQRAN